MLVHSHLENFETEEQDKRNWIVEQLKPVALELMSDTFGNFVIQKVLEKGTDEHREVIY